MRRIGLVLALPDAVDCVLLGLIGAWPKGEGTLWQSDYDQEAFDKMRSAIKSYRQQHGRFPPNRAIVEALVENRPWSCAARTGSTIPIRETRGSRSTELRPADSRARPARPLLRAALGFAGCSMPSYDRALHALRSWLDSWSGLGHVAESSLSRWTSPFRGLGK